MKKLAKVRRVAGGTVEKRRKRDRKVGGEERGSCGASVRERKRGGETAGGKEGGRRRG